MREVIYCLNGNIESNDNCFLIESHRGQNKFSVQNEKCWKNRAVSYEFYNHQNYPSGIQSK